MISLVESFLCPYKQRTPEEVQRIQWPVYYVSSNNNKDKDNSQKNHNQNSFTTAESLILTGCSNILALYQTK